MGKRSETAGDAGVITYVGLARQDLLATEKNIFLFHVGFPLTVLDIAYPQYLHSNLHVEVLTLHGSNVIEQ